MKLKATTSSKAIDKDTYIEVSKDELESIASRSAWTLLRLGR